jgi:uncharacterized protein (DUF849 family)
MFPMLSGSFSDVTGPIANRWHRMRSIFGQHDFQVMRGAGRAQMPIAAMAAAQGGNVRVGL